MCAYASTNLAGDGYNIRHGLGDSNLSNNYSVHILVAEWILDRRRTASVQIHTVRDGERANGKQDAFGIAKRHQLDAPTH